MPDTITDIKQLIRTDTGAARKAIAPALKAVEKKGDDAQKADVYHLMGLIEFYDNKSRDCIKWYNKELKIREKLNDVKGISDILNNIGAIYFTNDKLEKAKGYYEMALSHRQSINDRKGIAAVYNNLGGILMKCGMGAEAFNMYSQALSINKELNDTERIGACLQNIGLTYLYQQDYDHAITCFEESLAIARSIRDRPRAIQLMINISTTLISQDKKAEAKKYYEECYKESKASKYHYGLILSLKSLAYIAQSENKFKESIRYYDDCIKVARSSDHMAELTTALSGIGMAYGSMGKYEEALSYLKDALAMARKTGIRQNMSIIYSDFSEIYEKLNDHKKAFEYYRKHIAIRDELVDKENTRLLNEAKTRYEVEKKEKETQLLKEKNEAVNVYARKLEVSNNSLKQFAHVASHDLREPLRMVSSYMGLLERSLGGHVTDDQRQFLTFAIDGAKRMDTLIHDLLSLAKVDADPRVVRVSLTDTVAEVQHNLEVLLREKSAKITASPLPDIMADRTQVMQLLQNIISNGIKYNESKNPQITIDYRQDGRQGILSIADNGIGIAPELRERAFELFQRVHTGGKYKGSGIGLAICKKITEGMGGTIAIDGNKGGGSVFTITLPLSVIRR